MISKGNHLSTAFLLLVGLTSNALAETIEHKFSSYHSIEEIPLLAMRKTMLELQNEIEDITQQLETLPSLTASLQRNAYGFHGGHKEAYKQAKSPRWTLDITFSNAPPLEKIVLIPAIERHFSEENSYGFPRRMRISQSTPKGFKQIQEWFHTECRDPGRYPFVIDIPKSEEEFPSNHVRIEVFQGALNDHRELFALDEILGIGNNTVHHPVAAKANTEYTAKPYWSIDYLIDQKTSLGLPTDYRLPHIEKRDFIYIFDTPPTNGCMVEIDLGSTRQPNQVALFPAAPPLGYELQLPGYGFPGQIDIEIITPNAKGEYGQIRKVPTDQILKNPDNNVVHIPIRKKGRWIRFHFNDFPIYKGKSTFALGEIYIHKDGVPFKVKISKMQGFPKKDKLRAAKLLLNRKANGAPTMTFNAWQEKILLRDHLTRRLNHLRTLKQSVEIQNNRIWKVGTISILIAIALLASTITLSILINCRRAMQRLRLQIAQDLHDEVGSNLGGVTMIAERIKRNTKDPDIHEDLNELNLMSHEAYAALGEVIWIIDKNTIQLPVLIHKITERIERVLGSLELIIDISPDCPDRIVSLNYKRHLIMFFRELINNCARHAHATQVRFSTSLEGRILILQFKDNGIGFDMTLPTKGWGLRNMEQRVSEMGGEIKLQSSPEKGTCMLLKIPLANISKEPKRTDKTSN